MLASVIMVIMCVVLFSPAEQHVISTAQGQLRGDPHEGYVSYLGVPYASLTSPDGRFKEAGLAPVWGGVREPRAAQCTGTTGEHCLQLDVHAPRAGPAPAHPVLAWLAAGGALRDGAGTLVRQGVVLVVIHHRIGPQGFLCLGDDMIPGNAGVKDAVLALRWIRDNIVAFNGDAARVVMAGQGFGAAMAEAVMLSPMATSLYHGVILQSGSVLAPWAFNYDAKERARTLGAMLHKGNNISAALRSSTIEELVDKSDVFDMPYFPFGICIDNAMKHEERLISEPPFDSLSSRNVGKAPMIIGFNSNEAYIFASILEESGAIKKAAQKMTFLLPEELKFRNDREMGQVAKQVEDMYFKSSKNLTAVLEYHRDAYFLNHIHRSARLHASTFGPVYYYQFSYSGELGVQELGLEKAGAAHSDELVFLFSEKQLDGEDKTVQTNLVKLWTNFVKSMNPNVKEPSGWEALDPEHVRLLDIGTDLNMIEFPHARATAMWDDIYDKYYYSRNRATG